MSDDEKLYAGKFKTVEDLEAGYKNSLPIFQENEELKKKVNELSSLPDNYQTPSDISFDGSKIDTLKSRAKEMGLTQKQYEKMIYQERDRIEKNTKSFEEAKKEVGEEHINILKDYVTKNYPKELHDNMVNTFIVNKTAREAAMNHRNSILNNRVPGIDKTPAGGYSVTRDDVQKAFDAKEKKPHDLKLRQNYLNVLSQYAENNRQ
jgi:membrane-associated HD superfamily phosphohydrolase